ncbi:MAG: hypothetical protein IJ678_02950, partial [Kiritimatiellae bacterium]|nr:hypothetical protein [Kiritimatiellia bacterium]
VELERSEFSKWAKAGKTIEESKKNRVSPTSSVSAICFVSVPNVWIDVDLLRGGGAYDRLVNLGGTLGSFWGTDLTKSGNRKIITANTTAEMMTAIHNEKGNLWGMTVYGHGSPDGFLMGPSGTGAIDQIQVYYAVKRNGYKINQINMMQCYSMTTVTGFVGSPIDFNKIWHDAAIHPYGYFGINVFGFDTGP